MSTTTTTTRPAGRFELGTLDVPCPAPDWRTVGQAQRDEARGVPWPIDGDLTARVQAEQRAGELEHWGYLDVYDYPEDLHERGAA